MSERLESYQHWSCRWRATVSRSYRPTLRQQRESCHGRHWLWEESDLYFLQGSGKEREREREREALTHIGGDKHPLRQFIIVQVFIEHGEVFRLRKTVGVWSHRVIAHQWTRGKLVYWQYQGDVVFGEPTCACAYSHSHGSSGSGSSPQTQNKAYPLGTSSS